MKRLPEGIMNVPGANYSRALEISGTLIKFPGILPELEDTDKGKKPKSSSFEQQVREVFEKIKGELKECSLSFDNLVEAIIIVNGKPTDRKFDLVNRISKEYYLEGKVKDLPVRGFYGVFLLFGAGIEIFFSAVKQVPEFLNTTGTSNPDQE